MKNYYYYDDNGNKRIVICDLAMKKEILDYDTTSPYYHEKECYKSKIERCKEKIVLLDNKLFAFNRYERIEDLQTAIEVYEEHIRRIEEKQDEHILNKTYVEVSEEEYEKKLKEMRIYNYIDLDERKDGI